MRRLVRFALAFAIVLPLLAFAQTATATDPVGMLAEGVKTLAESAQAKNWALFIPTLVILIVSLFRWAGSKFAAEGTKFRVFLDNQWTRWGMNFATTFAGAFVGAATAKIPISVNLVINALMMSFAAAGGVQFFRDVMERVGNKKAVDAGKGAANSPGKTLNG